MGPFDGLFGGLFGLLVQELQRRILMVAFINNNPWMTNGDKDFTAYPQLWGDCENVVGEHHGCSDEEYERGNFYGTVGMYRMNRQNPEMAIHETCLEKDRL